MVNPAPVALLCSADPSAVCAVLDMTAVTARMINLKCSNSNYKSDSIRKSKNSLYEWTSGSYVRNREVDHSWPLDLSATLHLCTTNCLGAKWNAKPEN